MRRDDPAVRESIQFLKNYAAGGGGGINLARSTLTAASFEATPPPPALLSTSLQQDDKSQFNAVVWFLRKRYAADSNEPDQPLSSFTPTDIRELLDCFGQELSSVVHKEKVKLTSQTSGEKRVNFEPQFSTASGSVSSKRSSTSLANNRSQSSVSTMETRTPLTPPSAFGKPLSSMTLRDAMQILRKGELVVKYSSAHGKPAYRFLSVRDGRVLYKSELVIMPLLCWSVDATASPSNQLELCLLTDVRRAISPAIVRDASGCLPGVTAGESVQPGCFISLIFPSRRVDVAFKRNDTADCWAFALRLVVAKNMTLQENESNS